jgi:hypothetical protein
LNLYQKLFVFYLKFKFNKGCVVGRGVGEAYEDISMVVLNVLQAEFGRAPDAE